jgi:HAD superfamily hydrolase (TIGR01509 family)
MNYEAVIFDIDGTLLDSVDLHAESWRQVFARHDRVVPVETLRGQIGKGGDQLLPMFFSREELDRFGAEMERERGELFRDQMLSLVQPFPGVRPLFERMHSDGLQLALASSAKAKEVEQYARLLQIEEFLSAGTSSEDAAKSKPHPDIFEAALKKLGSPNPAEVLVVGDSPYDVEAAAKIGMRTIGMLCGGFPEDDLRRAGALAIYTDPEALLAAYEQSPLSKGVAVNHLPE